MSRTRATPRRFRPGLIGLCVALVGSIVIGATVVSHRAISSAPNSSSPEVVATIAAPATASAPTIQPSPTPTATSTATATQEPTEIAPSPTQHADSPAPTATIGTTATPTPTPTATTAATERPTSTPRPTFTPRPTRTATPSPAATATPAISRAQLIENGGFESGTKGWTVESGARAVAINAHIGYRALMLPAAGGIAKQLVELRPGGSYQLSAWGLLGAEGDSAVISVTLIDGHGDPLADLESPALEFDNTSYTKQSVTFTVPEGVSQVLISISKPAGPGILAVDDLSLREIAPGSDESE